MELLAVECDGCGKIVFIDVSTPSVKKALMSEGWSIKDQALCPKCSKEVGNG